MASYSFSLSSTGSTSETFGGDFFGSNVIFTKDYLDDGGVFDRFLETMDFGGYRFPGGTVTEELFAPGSDMAARFFDISTPSGIDPDGGDRIVTAPAMFEYATLNGGSLHLTVPTENYFGEDMDGDGGRDPAPFGLYRLFDEVDHMIRGDYGDVTLDMLTIGNEFWYLDSRQSAEEYGHIVDHVAVGLQAIFDAYQASLDDPSSWVQPLISVQVALGNRPDDNQAILDELSPEARAAIDAVETHFYKANYWDITHSQGMFDRMDDFQNAEGFGDLKYFVSKWNVARADDSDLGLTQASDMI